MKKYPVKLGVLLICISCIICLLPNISTFTTVNESSTKGSVAYFARTYDGEHDELYPKITVAHNRIFMLCTTNSFGEGGYDVWLVCMDLKGRILWEFSIGGSADDYGVDMAVWQERIYIVGATASYGYGGYDAWILEATLDGEIIEQYTVGSSDDEFFTAITVATDGIYIAGVNSGYQLVMVKITHIGVREWSKVYNLQIDEPLVKITLLSDEIILSGTLFVAGNRDIFVLSVAKNGNVNWCKRYHGPSDEFAWNLICINSSFYLAGGTRSFGAGATDALIIKTNRTGHTIWQKTYGAEREDAFYACGIHENFLYLAGETNSFGNTYRDLWVVKTTLDGEIVWQKIYGGSGDDCFCRSIFCDNHLYFTGQINSFGVSGYASWVVQTSLEGEIVFSDPDAFTNDTSATTSSASLETVEVSVSVIDAYLSSTFTSATPVATNCTVKVQAEISNTPPANRYFLCDTSESYLYINYSFYDLESDPLTVFIDVLDKEGIFLQLRELNVEENITLNLTDFPRGLYYVVIIATDNEFNTTLDTVVYVPNKRPVIFAQVIYNENETLRVVWQARDYDGDILAVYLEVLAMQNVLQKVCGLPASGEYSVNLSRMPVCDEYIIRITVDDFIDRAQVELVWRREMPVPVAEEDNFTIFLFVVITSISAVIVVLALLKYREKLFCRKKTPP